MTNTILIKRSISSAEPTVLFNGELAWSDLSDTLFIGKAGSVVAVGGLGVFAPRNSPVFTGTPTAPTPTLTDSSLRLATTAYVKGQRLNQLTAPNLSVSFNSQKLINLASPTLPNDATNKAYVDAIATGLDIKDSARVATISDIALTGVQTIDGILLVAGDRILVKDQLLPVENGIYIVDTGTWIRAGDYDTSIEVSPGSFIFIQEGITQADTGWVLITNAPITLNSTDLVFTQFSSVASYQAAAPISKIGDVFSLDFSPITLINNLGYLQVAGGTTGQVLSSQGPTTEASWGLLNLASNVTGTLPVNRGGTGVATLTGLIKGSGTSAFTAAIPGTDYLVPSSNLNEISVIPSLTGDEGTIPIIDNTGTFIGRRGNDLLTAIGVVGFYLPLTGGTLTGPLSIQNTIGNSLITTRNVGIGLSDPTLGVVFNPNDTLLTVSGKVDRPGLLLLNNPKSSITAGDVAGRVSFNLSSSTQPLKSVSIIEGYAEGVAVNIGGGLRFKVKADGSNLLLDSLTINSEGNILIGYGDQAPVLPSPLIPVVGDRNLTIAALPGSQGYLVLGQGNDKGTLRWASNNFQYYRASTSSWVSLDGGGGGSSNTTAFTTDVGDGTNNSITVTHNLGSKNVIWQVYENGNSFEDVIPTVRRISNNALQFVFTVAPTLNQFKVVITYTS
jgi:hypothetical protein